MAFSIQNRRLAIAGGVGLAAVSLAAAVAMVGPRDGAGVRGPGVQIAHFVAEPAPIEPGSTLEVGELTDGYVHRPVPPIQDVAWEEPDYDLSYVEREDSPVYYAAADADRAPDPEDERPSRREPDRVDRYGFGFEPREEVERRIVLRAPPERRPDRGRESRYERDSRLEREPRYDRESRYEREPRYERRPERRSEPAYGDLPPPAAVTGERQAVFY